MNVLVNRTSASSRFPALQAAVVLHTRPYQNTSMLIDFFCEESGLLRCVSKGQRSRKNAGQLRQFSVLNISFSGKTDLKTLTHCEMSDNCIFLEGQALFIGLYVNEVLLRLLIQYDPHPALFKHTSKLYQDLSTCNNQYELEEKLRAFEFRLLREMGYLVDFTHDCHDGSLVKQNDFYRYEPEQGFYNLNKLHQNEDAQQRSISGASLLLLADLIAKGDFSFSKAKDKENFRKECKWLSRVMLAPYIGEKPLQSRKLFESVKQIGQ